MDNPQLNGEADPSILYLTKQNFTLWTSFCDRRWRAEIMAPYYRKFRTFYHSAPKTQQQLSLDSYVNENAQGTQGPLPIIICESSSSFGSAWLEAFQS
ncbi:hypothetical protein VTN77DRAFT_8158 [Rasamsonia byssochlamydoides]|uniref:uncharacterized protein n=1 Tax=Rasamsonia byssochlamydoides TaxID=89139 RepID=UPI003743731A